jgi:hypothetical protein
MLRTLLALPLLLGAIAFTATACGSSSEASATTEASASEEAATPEQAVAEIEAIQGLLDDALTSYRDGDADAAETTVGDAYLEHFEKVEDPLGERDHDFMEDLEHRISTEIRDAMKAGKPADEVAALVERTNADLDTAKTKLQETE